MRGERRGTWAWVILGLLAGGCQPQEREAVHKVGERTAAQFDGVTGPARGRLTAGWLGLRGARADATPDSRVALRCGWDAQLAGADLRVTSPGPGAVRLEGTVADARQRRRAVEVARTTLG